MQVGKEANSGDVRLAAKVTEPSTGLKLTVLTNAPGKGGGRQGSLCEGCLSCGLGNMTNEGGLGQGE